MSRQHQKDNVMANLVMLPSEAGRALLDTSFQQGDLSAAYSYVAKLEQANADRLRFETALSLTDEVLYEYDELDDTLYLVSSRFEKTADEVCGKITVADYRIVMRRPTYIHPDNVDRYQAFCCEVGDATLSQEESTYTFECRLSPGFHEIKEPSASCSFLYQRIIGKRISDSAGNPLKFVGRIIDVSEEAELVERSSTDTLTGAFNRSYLQARLHEYGASKQPEMSYVCLLADIDFFKSVNDGFGHLAGDNLLVEFVAIARSLFRASDLIARLGGDEFMILMRDVYDARIATEKAEALIEKFHNAAMQHRFPHEVSLSIGVVVAQDRRSFHDLYHQADIALYQAKATGKNKISMFSEGMLFPQDGPVEA